MGQNALQSSIPGIVIQFPNKNVATLKQSPWAEILGLLGQNGEEIMMRLLLDCGIYAPIDAPRGVLYQLSGMSDLPLTTQLKRVTYPNAGLPLSALEPLGRTTTPLCSKLPPKQENTDRKLAHSPNSILFLRRRMLYSRLGSLAGKSPRDGLDGSRTSSPNQTSIKPFTDA